MKKMIAILTIIFIIQGCIDLGDNVDYGPNVDFLFCKHLETTTTTLTTVTSTTTTMKAPPPDYLTMRKTRIRNMSSGGYTNITQEGCGYLFCELFTWLNLR